MRHKHPNRLFLFFLSLPILLISCTGLPRDTAIEGHFYRHKAEFEELTTLIESAYQRVGRLYNSDSYLAYLRTQPRYTELLETVGASSGVALITSRYSAETDRFIPSPDPYAIIFVLGEAGFFRAGLFGESKGIVYFLVPPLFDRTNILVSNTDRGDKVSGSDETNFYRYIKSSAK